MGDTVRFADGFDGPDTVAFGLAAPQLLLVVAAAAVAYCIVHLPLAPVVTMPLALALGCGAAIVAWGRVLDQPLLDWAVCAGRFALAPRERGFTILRSDGLSDAGSRADDPPDSPALPADVAAQPWARWWRRGSPAPQPDPEANDPVTPENAIEWLRDALAGPVEEGAAPAGLPPEVLPGPVAPEPSPATREPAPPPRALTVLAPADAAGEAVDSETDDPGAVIIPFARALADEDSPEIDIDGPRSAGAGVVVEPPAVTPDAAPVFVGAPRRITFFALNGGTGRTTLATEVAALLAARGVHSRDGITTQPLKVALLDLDLRSATVAVRLGIPHPTLWDFVMNEPSGADALDDYLVTHRSGLRALLGPPKPVTSGRGIEPARIAEIVHRLESDGYHFIFFDVAADLNALTTWVLSAVHDIFVVLTPTASGAQDAYRTTEALRRMGLRHKLSYVVNRSRGGLDLREVMGDLGGRVLASIPQDDAVEDAENEHRLVAQRDGAAATAIASLAAHLYPPLQAAVPRRRLGLRWRRRAG